LSVYLQEIIMMLLKLNIEIIMMLLKLSVEIMMCC